MSQDIEHFLLSAKSDIDSIDIVEVKFKTKSGYGYNLRNNQYGYSYYYHMKSNQTLNVGDNYLITFEKSKRALDRLDVVSAIEIVSFDDLTQKLWVDENLRTLLINEFFNAALFKIWIKDKLIAELLTTSEALNDFLKPLPIALIDSLVDEIPLCLLPSCIEYCGSQSTVTVFLIEEGLPNDQQAENKIVDFCHQHNLDTCLYLIELLKGKVTAQSFDSVLLSSVIEDVFKFDKKDPTLFILSLINLNPSCFKPFCNLAYEHERLKKQVQGKLIELPEDYLQLPSYVDGFCDEIKVAIIDSIPLQRLPDCLELKANSDNIRNYLIAYYKKSSVEINQKIKSYCVEKSDQENIFFIDLLANKASEINLTVNQVVLLFKAILCSAKTEINIEQLIFSNTLVFKELCNSLFSENEFKNIVFDGLLKQMPDTANKISGYIEGLSDLIIIQLSEQVELPLIPAFLDYRISEKRLCEYFVECSEQVDVNQITGYITEHQYCHARLLLNVIKLSHEGRSFVPNLIVEQVKEYQQALFAKHSNTRTKIDPFILTACRVLSHKYLKPQTCCEGHLYYSKNKDKWGVKCRTNVCDVIYDELCGFSEDNQFNNALFYRLINKLHGVSAAQLHQQESFTRSVAALNRWNDILDRLHCNDCNNPLALSEHAKNSMGKMAIGATYWHCNDKTCKQFCHSIKLSYCLGCNKVIDSRIDTQSCKPFEIKSFKKFYICNSCSSCCREHSGFSGRCGHCGKAHAYVNDGKGSYSPKATCQFCDKRVSINYRSFEQLTKLNDLALKQNDKMYKFVYSENMIGGNAKALREVVLPWRGKTLYVYDLFSNLQNKNITFSMLSNFDHIYDVKILERIVDLGLYHKNYESAPPSETSFLGIFNSIVDEQSALSAQITFQQRINDVFNLMNQQNLWPHYAQVEMPFLYALHDLLGDGIRVVVDEVTRLFEKTEISRNTLVEGLRKKGLETPDNGTFATYIKRVYPDQDTPSVMKAIERADYKMFKEVNSEFSAMHKISKLERMGSLFKQIGHFQGAFIPDYQIMGAETGRCISKSPNLLGFPKEIRSIVKAKPGHGIVECDYSQMEIGVMAAMSDDETMIADYNSGDVYQTLADALGLTRERAKLVFLSILYGVGITTLASWLQLTSTQAKQIVEQFFQRYHKAKQLQDKLISQGNQTGYVQATSGLRRRVNYNAVQGRSNQKKQFLQHWQNNWFKNFPIQASAAIVFKKAIITLAENNRGGIKLIAPMYDAIVFEAPLAELDEYTRVVEAAMIRAMLEQFPKLKPHIKTNNHDVSCWNADGTRNQHNVFLSEIIES